MKGGRGRTSTIVVVALMISGRRKVAMVIARVVRDIQHSILARDVTAPDRTLYSVAWYSSCGETRR